MEPVTGGRPPYPRLDVCLCAHNPRVEVLGLVLRSLAAQGAGPSTFRVLLVDNASRPALPEKVLAPLRDAGREASITREERPGLTIARLHAIQRTSSPWVLFVDDDSELTAGFVEEGMAFIERHPEVGCFGGKLLRPRDLQVPRWAEAFLPYLAIKDEGDEVITGVGREWGPWEPPGAGIWVHREVLEIYRTRVETDARGLDLGRKGRQGLASCEDALMSRSAAQAGMLVAYNPRMALYHHIDPSRLRLRYLLRLMRSYGRSHVLLDSILNAEVGTSLIVPEYYRQAKVFGTVLRHAFRDGRKKSLRFGLGMVLYHWDARAEYLRLEREESQARPALPPSAGT